MRQTEIISPSDKYEYFFGYYDLQPYSTDGNFHLAHRAEFADRRPRANDACEVGFIELKSKRFMPLGKTYAWNFQQGALLNWNGDDGIIYNDRRDGAFCTVMKNVKTGAEKIIPRPLACIDSSRKKGLSVNFSRIYDFRAGYGYAGIPDKYADTNAPDGDGIFLVDLQSGEEKLIISYDGIKRRFPLPPFTDCKLVVNHITFNPSGTRFFFLLRNFPKDGGKWGTMLVTSDLQGNMRNLTDFRVVSHYDFKDDDTIMAVSDFDGSWDVYFIKDDDETTHERIKSSVFTGQDVHCLYSPDRKYISGDGYPDADNLRTLYLYDAETHKTEILTKQYSRDYGDLDIRCDLHARWNRKGDRLSLDTTHNGRREIAQIIL